MSEEKTIQPPKKAIWIPFLGSMNLAVTLLIMLAIASVIGTVLQQDQSVQDYTMKFGPFWAQVFKDLGLFHVYGAAWFVLVLLFLLLSTATCVVRHTPKFMQDMKHFNEKLSIRAYQHQPYKEVLQVENFDPQQAQALLTKQGFKTKVHQREDGLTIAGMKGQWNRLGYFFTHASIIIICVGALFDSNLLLKYREIAGNLEAETRSVSLKEIPQKSWLGDDNFSFRGSVNVAEGQKTDVLFLPYEDGFLVQKLPFTLLVEDFRIDYYDTGMPKNYASDLVLVDPELDEPIRKTIEVNTPLYYKNYAIYQSSFGDGGSHVNFSVYPLLSPEVNPAEVKTAVNQTESLKTPIGTFKAEIENFRLFNMVPLSEEEQAKTGKKFVNNGPSVKFKVRNDQGKAWEYENYLSPNIQEGRWFFMSGMRATLAEPYRYMFIPADAEKKTKRFFKFLALMNNPIKAGEIIKAAYPKSDEVSDKNYQLQLRLMQQLMSLFRQKGFNGVTEFVNKSVPEAEREKVKEYYFAQTSIALQTLFLYTLEQEDAKKIAQGVNDFDKQWFEDALAAISALSGYGPPMYFELTGFKHIESTGLQITKSPGKDIVYFGSTLLIIGVFFLFYVRQKRVWLAYSEADKTLTFAGKDTKNLPETAREFAKMTETIKTELVKSPEEAPNQSNEKQG